MNGKERAKLAVLSNEIAHIKSEQAEVKTDVKCILNKLNEGSGKIARNRTWISAFKWILGALGTAILYLIFKPF